MTLFSGGIAADLASADASKAFIDFLTGQEARSQFKAKGFEPGGYLFALRGSILESLYVSNMKLPLGE